ncbi:MAG: hypothetical protein RL660_3108 [Bacteroidota bacterium]
MKVLCGFQPPYIFLWTESTRYLLKVGDLKQLWLKTLSSYAAFSAAICKFSKKKLILLFRMSGGYKINDQSAIHFVTFTVVDWVDVFSRKIYRDIVIDSFRYCQMNKGLLVFGYCIMSNHVHAILQSSTGELSKIIGELKRHCATTILKTIATTPESRKDWMLKRFEFAAMSTNNNEVYKFWRNGNHPEEVYSPDFFWIKLNYIHMNPVRAGIVEKAHQYIYCSASNYISGSGLLQIELQSPPLTSSSGRNNFISLDLW